MIDRVSNSEFLLTQKTAEEYRNKGYEVSRDVLLDFFPDFYADLVVQKGADRKVVEVKQRSSLAADPRIRELARIIDSKPGWSFELLLVGEPEKLDSPEGASSFRAEDISERIGEAEEALMVGLPEAGFILAWSALEAVTRILVTTQGASHEGIPTPAFTLDQAVSLGVIPIEDYEQLTEMRKCRNAIVHGFSLRDFDEDIVRDLIGTVRRLQSSS